MAKWYIFNVLFRLLIGKDEVWSVSSNQRHKGFNTAWNTYYINRHLLSKYYQTKQKRQNQWKPQLGVMFLLKFSISTLFQQSSVTYLTKTHVDLNSLGISSIWTSKKCAFTWFNGIKFYFNSISYKHKIHVCILSNIYYVHTE